MNIFDTTSNGGIPFVWDDFRFEQDAVRESFKGIIDSFGAAADEGYVLSGCEQTVNAPNIDISAGFIVLEGEVYKVDAHSVPQTPGAGNSLFWKVIETDDPAGTKTLESAASAETYKIRTAAVVDETTPGGLFTPITAPTLAAKMAILVKPEIGVWTTINLVSNPDVKQNPDAFGAGVSVSLFGGPTTGFLKYLVIGKMVHLTYRLIFTVKSFDAAPASSVVIENLPFTFSADLETNTSQMSNNGSAKGLSGANQVFGVPSTSVLGFNIPTIGGGFGSFNRDYDFLATPLKDVTPVGATNVVHNWTIQGSATFALT